MRWIGHQVQCSSVISDKMHTPFLCIPIGTPTSVIWFSLLFMATGFSCVLLFGLTKDYSFLTETNVCFWASMPWFSDRSNFIHLPADEIHSNLDSILEFWLRIAHPCSNQTYFWTDFCNKSHRFFTISFREENWKPPNGSNFEGGKSNDFKRQH